MKTNYKLKPFNFVLAGFLMMAFSTAATVTKAYAASSGPDVLITEVMPLSQTNDDSFEYIELYNNTDKNIDLKDYKLPLQNIDVATSKIISPKGVLVVCTKGSTTLQAFNNFYGTSLTSDKFITLPFVNEVLSNSSAASVLFAKDDGTVISRAQYGTTDFQVKKSITYKYPETGFDMITLGKSQNPTPGSIASNQIPPTGISVTSVTLDKSFVTMDVSKTAVLYATVAPATAVNKSVIWTSNNPAVVEVNQSGVLTSKAVGVAKITVTTVDGAFTDDCTIVVDKVPVTGVTLDKTSSSIEVGKAIVLAVSVTPENATNKAVTWRSSNSNIASVDSNGIVYGKAAGEAIITVETVDLNYKAICKVIVTNTNAVVPVRGVTLDKTNVTLNQGKVIVLTPQINPANATNKKVTWKSSDSSVATVDSNGIVIAKNIGWSLITATSEDGGYMGYCLVRVDKVADNIVPVKDIELNTKIVQMNKGGNETLKAKVSPDDATNKSVTWSTENPSVITIDSNGKITALNRGIAIVTASTVDGKFKDSCIVIVWDNDSSWEDKEIFRLRLNKTFLWIKEGKHEQLTPIITPGYLKKTNLVWKSDDNSIASVTEDGRVYGKNEGRTTIRVLKGGKELAKCTVWVTDNKDNGNGKGKGQWKKED